MKTVYLETSFFGYLTGRPSEICWLQLASKLRTDGGANIVIGLTSLSLKWLKTKPAKAIPRPHNGGYR